MATLTVGDVTPRAQYTATNAQTAFTYSFPIFADGDLKVYIGSTLKTLTTDYTVSGAGTSSGGTVTLVTGATTGDVVTIVRDIPIARSSDYQTGGALLSETLNDDFDKLVMMAQQNESAINTRSIRFSETSGDLPLPELAGDAATRANKTLIFDEDGNPALDDTNINVSTITDNIDKINTVAGDLNGSRDSFDYGSIASTDPVSNPASPTGALQGVYDIRTDITTVSGISANVTTVANNDTNVTSVADNMDTIITASTAANSAAADAASAEIARAAAVVAKTAAETAETNAETAETNAGTSETNAATSATSASTSASTATTQATSATASATSATASATSATSSASSATTSAATATTKATAASTSATNAATSETNAGTSETNAATSASGAATSATNAATSATNAETAYDNFDDRYLGQKSSDPSVDNDSNALLTGAIYFNTTSSAMKVYNGSAWTNVAPVATSVTASQISDVTATATELNYVDGVTSSIQTQLDGKETTGAITRSASINMADNVLQRPELKDYSETKVAMGANDVDLSAGNVFTKTISGAQTLTFSNPPATGKAGAFTLILTNGGSATVTFINSTGTVKWAAATAPTLTAAGVDVLTFTTIDGGTIWYGIASGIGMA